MYHSRHPGLMLLIMCSCYEPLEIRKNEANRGSNEAFLITGREGVCAVLCCFISAPAAAHVVPCATRRNPPAPAAGQDGHPAWPTMLPTRPCRIASGKDVRDPPHARRGRCCTCSWPMVAQPMTEWVRGEKHRVWPTRCPNAEERRQPSAPCCMMSSANLGEDRPLTPSSRTT